jgi:hypothetical protein
MVPCRKFYGEEALKEMKEKLAELYGGSGTIIVQSTLKLQP